MMRHFLLAVILSAIPLATSQATSPAKAAGPLPSRCNPSAPQEPAQGCVEALTKLKKKKIKIVAPEPEVAKSQIFMRDIGGQEGGGNGGGGGRR